jgi:hypothetical protein
MSQLMGIFQRILYQYYVGKCGEYTLKQVARILADGALSTPRFQVFRGYEFGED